MKPDSENILAKWLAGTLSPAETEALEKENNLSEMQVMLKQLDNYGYPEMNEKALFQKILANRDKKPAKIRQLFPLFMKSAAAVLVIGVLFWFFTDNRKVLLAEVGESQNYTLPDLSKVSLNAGSKIRLAEGNWPESRTLELAGEAYFKVQKGSTFTVETALGNVQVLGTQFDVFVRKGVFQVVCYEGKVKVLGENVAINEVLTAGKAIRIVGKKIIRYEVEDEKAPWMDGKLTYYETSLAEIFEELERQFTFRLDYPSAISNKRFTGEILLQNKQIALKMVCSAMSLQYEEKGNGIIQISPLE